MVMALTVFMVRNNSLELKAWVHQERMRAYVLMYACMFKNCDEPTV